MMLFLAEATTVMGVEINTLVTVGTALGVIWAFYSKMNAAEEHVAKRVKALIIADAAEADKKGTPQPLIVEMAKDFVTRDSYHKHCEINRQSHRELGERIDEQEEKRERDKHEIIRAGEERAKHIHDRLNVAIEAMAELRGKVDLITRRRN